MKAITMGADFEGFPWDQEEDAYDPSYINTLGDKENKKPILGEGSGYFIHKDNACVELNIPPRTHVSTFVSSVSNVIQFIPYSLKFIPVCSLKHEQSSQIQNYMNLGCAPELNAYTNDIFPPARAHRFQIGPHSFRTAGFHIHLGWNTSAEKRLTLVKLMDLFVALPLELMISKHNLIEPHDRDVRRTVYGKAGACRLTTYDNDLPGLEYRVLGAEVAQWTRVLGPIMNLVMRMISRFKEYAPLVDQIDMNEAQKLINQRAFYDDQADEHLAIVHELEPEHSLYYKEMALILGEAQLWR